MALGRPIWAPSNLTADGAIKANAGVKLSTTAGQVEECDTANEFVYAVAAKAHADNDQFEGWLLYGSDIVECKAAGAITAGDDVAVNGSGEFVGGGTGAKFIVGFVAAAVADNDVFQLHCAPGWRNS